MELDLDKPLLPPPEEKSRDNSISSRGGMTVVATTTTDSNVEDTTTSNNDIDENRDTGDRHLSSSSEALDTNHDVGATTMPTSSSPSSSSTNNNEDAHSAAIPVVPWYSNPMQVTAMISNFSTSYNVVNISLVIPILSATSDTGQATEEDKAAVASSLLAGMVLGQLVGGGLGDSFLGRLGALRLVMLLQIIASLGSMSCSDDEVYLELSTWRFVLGIGAGGVYPLAAVLSAEQSGDGGGGGQDHHDSSINESLHRVVLTFSMQGLGFVAVPLVTVLLLYTVPRLDIIWRIIVGLGSIPGILLLILQWRLYRSHRQGSRLQVLPTEDVVDDDDNHDDEIDTAVSSTPPPEENGVEEGDDGEDGAITSNDSTNNTQPIDPDGDGIYREIQGGRNEAIHHGWWDSIRHEDDLMKKLLGTACTWFLFDVLFYGNTLFEPIVIEAAFGAREASNPLHLLRQTALDSLLLTSIALPGYAVAGVALGNNNKACCISQSPRFVMMQGFAVMSVLYLTVGLAWNDLKRFPVVLVILYSLTFFFANYGPNTTTFVLPSLIYSAECRSTFNGISAASGKMGALLGATLFAPAADSFGDAAVMIICSGVSIFAFILTKLFVRVKDDEGGGVAT